MADLASGETFADRFEVVGTLGRGGMATVYLVHDRVRDERVALKVLHDHLADNPSMRERLRREVLAAGLVRHEAALVAHDLHIMGDTLALSMPFHSGTTLAERVRAEGALGAEEVRQLGIRLAGALADAHRHGLLHRDVTPNNVLLRGAGDAVLTDFGLARTLDSTTATATSVMGTPGYAAPEVFAGQRTEPRSDLYSLGAVLYFAASGRSPYGSGAPAAILQAQLAREPDPLGALCPHLPPSLVETIDALLGKRADRRPASAAEVVRALQSSRSAVVTEVPDTWDPAEEPMLPPSALGHVHVPSALPEGEWEVVAKGRKGCDARELADNLGFVLDLPAGALAVTRPMRTRKEKFRVAPPTDRATAVRLAEAAQTAGYRAELFDTRPASALQRVMGLSSLLIPLIWIAFPFYTLPTLGLPLALILSIGATLLIPSLTAPFAKHKAEADLPLALSSDLARHVVSGEPASTRDDLDEFIEGLGLPPVLRDIAREITSDDDVRRFALHLRRGFAGEAAPSGPPTAPPSQAPSPAPHATRAQDLRGRALGNLDLLSASLDTAGDALPAPARADLRRTSAELRVRAVELARTAVALEAGLAATPEPEDVSWVHGRLTRLETMERAGEAVDVAERARLVAALRSADEAGVARENLESQLTSALAQLLEIGAMATRARAELLEPDVPRTARVLVEQLDQQVAAVDATRQQMARMRARVSERR